MRSRSPVGQPLAGDAAQGFPSSGRIINTECNAIAVSKFKLGKITVKVLLSTMLVLEGCRLIVKVLWHIDADLPPGGIKKSATVPTGTASGLRTQKMENTKRKPNVPKT